MKTQIASYLLLVIGKRKDAFCYGLIFSIVGNKNSHFAQKKLVSIKPCIELQQMIFINTCEKIFPMSLWIRVSRAFEKFYYSSLNTFISFQIIQKKVNSMILRSRCFPPRYLFALTFIECCQPQYYSLLRQLRCKCYQLYDRVQFILIASFGSINRIPRLQT